MKRKVLKRRKDGVKQHYWTGRKVIKRKKGLSLKALLAIKEQHDKVFGENSKVEPDLVLASPALTRSVFGEQRIKKRKVERKSVSLRLARKSGDGLTRQEYRVYRKIAEMARRKGYRIPRINLRNGPLLVDEVNIPEYAQTEAYLLPDVDVASNNEIYTVLVDDDAEPEDKIKAFAHELGHIHMYMTGERQTEGKADRIAADILGVSPEEVQFTEHYRGVLKRAKW